MGDSLHYLRKENRRGEFLIREKNILNARVRKAIAQCVIVRAEYAYSLDAMRYEAYCPDFDQVENGCESPKYQLYLRVDGRVCWRKHDNNYSLSDVGAVIEY